MEILYNLSIGVFISLFIFIFFMFIVCILSLFKKENYPDFEPKVTVIVPTYNEEKNIAKCIDSILDSDYPKEKLELIIVDDGSTDKTREIVKKYNIKLLKQEHKGKSEAINYGVKHAKNEFIVTIDADSYIKKDFIKKIVKPFSDKTVAATTGIIKISNDNKLLTSFQAIEYNMHNMVRNSFSKIFNNSVWFLGALACYRKSVLEKIGFKKESLIEDMFLAMEIKKNGYKTLSVADAYGYTEVPEKIKNLYNERIRWWVGGFQAISKNKDMFRLKYGWSIIFLFINQIYWSIYAILSLPLIIYQVLYWLPYNLGTITQAIIYFVRWFSLWGSIYVLYNIPKNGISFFTFFGVISGILSLIIILLGMILFKEKLSFKKILAIFFYFPYTIVLNIIILISLLKMKSFKQRYFIR